MCDSVAARRGGVTLMLGVYRFLREASAAERLSVLQFTHMAWSTLEDTPVFLLRPCEVKNETEQRSDGSGSGMCCRYSLVSQGDAKSARQRNPISAL